MSPAAVPAHRAEEAFTAGAIKFHEANVTRAHDVHMLLSGVLNSAAMMAAHHDPRVEADPDALFIVMAENLNRYASLAADLAHDVALAARKGARSL